MLVVNFKKLIIASFIFFFLRLFIHDKQTNFNYIYVSNVEYSIQTCMAFQL